ncbi:unnamed protein product [Acanthoscelides obtectus]|uniref:Uncharacterized protein n=1 Tax=Acanthoscelides obtectus TaxID=200917 RepID=A0A9P0K8A0_ACAOB|nr:unnamed protein product [Acanthoscelides obtectus]CAK1656016.1 hypothetical protein AOBTE_LOCUS19515 [Acanthoscelides obtectus]
MKYSRGSQMYTRNVFRTEDQRGIRTERIYSPPHCPTQTQWRRTHAFGGRDTAQDGKVPAACSMNMSCWV